MPSVEKDLCLLTCHLLGYARFSLAFLLFCKGASGIIHTAGENFCLLLFFSLYLWFYQRIVSKSARRTYSIYCTSIIATAFHPQVETRCFCNAPPIRAHTDGTFGFLTLSKALREAPTSTTSAALEVTNCPGGERDAVTPKTWSLQSADSLSPNWGRKSRDTPRGPPSRHPGYDDQCCRMRVRTTQNVEEFKRNSAKSSRQMQVQSGQGKHVKRSVKYYS